MLLHHQHLLREECTADRIQEPKSLQILMLKNPRQSMTFQHHQYFGKPQEEHLSIMIRMKVGIEWYMSMMIWLIEGGGR